MSRLMRAGEWKPWTPRLLAKEWDLAPSTVRREAAEAAAYHRATDINPNLAGIDSVVALQFALEGAMEDTELYRGDRMGLKARDQVIVAAKALSDVTGATAPQKIAVAVAEVTPQRAAEIMAGYFGKVTPDP
jgi:hypothetical protein